jgi:hypothetical protein
VIQSHTTTAYIARLCETRETILYNNIPQKWTWVLMSTCQLQGTGVHPECIHKYKMLRGLESIGHGGGYLCCSAAESPLLFGRRTC